MQLEEDPTFIAEPVPHPVQPRLTGNPPPTRVSKTGKVQDLVAVKGPKLPDPIRGIAGRSRFTIDRILKLPIEIELGELLDRSDSTIKELAMSMQRSTPRYRARRSTRQVNSVPVTSVIGATPDHLPPPITAHALEDDGLSQPLMIKSWIGSVRCDKTLLDGGSVVELISQKKINSLRPSPKIYEDGKLTVSLATDRYDVLTKYVIIPINVEGVQAMVKAWIVPVVIYDLLLGIPWMRRVRCRPHYDSGSITICGDNGQVREVPAEMAPISVNLPVVEFEGDDDSVDAACQQLLDKQENAQL